MKTATHRTQIYLTQEQYRYLRQQAERKKASLAQIIREIIDERLPKKADYDENPLFSLGKDKFSLGRKHGAQKHDDYIYRKKK